MKDKPDLGAKVDGRMLLDFEENVTWRALIETIEERIEIIRTELERGVVMIKGEEGEKTPYVLTHDDMKRRQGEIAALRYTMQLPTILKEEKEQGEQIKKEG
jgi:hypothetical protein